MSEPISMILENLPSLSRLDRLLVFDILCRDIQRDCQRLSHECNELRKKLEDKEKDHE